MSRDKLPVEKGMYNDAFSFPRFSHVARTNDPIYNQHCGSTIRYNVKLQRTHTALIRPLKKSPALENINMIL